MENDLDFSVCKAQLQILCLQCVEQKVLILKCPELRGLIVQYWGKKKSLIIKRTKEIDCYSRAFPVYVVFLCSDIWLVFKCFHI